MCATLQDILENEGYEAHVALTGAEAIAQCQARRFDVILMDVLMPDLCGVEVYRRIKTLAPDTRVIMMSAYSVEDLKREALAAGAIAFLPKPLEVEVVLRLVQEVKSPPVLLVMGDPDESAATGGGLTFAPVPRLYRPSGFKPLFYLKLEAPLSSVSASRGSGLLPIAQTDHELGCEMTS